MATERELCVGGLHNWGDLSAGYDAMVMAYARGLTRQTLTVLCDSCGVTMRFVRVTPKRPRKVAKARE